MPRHFRGPRLFETLQKLANDNNPDVGSEALPSSIIFGPRSEFLMTKPPIFVTVQV